MILTSRLRYIPVSGRENDEKIEANKFMIHLGRIVAIAKLSDIVVGIHTLAVTAGTTSRVKWLIRQWTAVAHPGIDGSAQGRF